MPDQHQSLRAIYWINPSRLPPHTFIGRAVNRAMMHRYRNKDHLPFVATLSARASPPILAGYSGSARFTEILPRLELQQHYRPIEIGTRPQGNCGSAL
jgi:hypothetical protein